MIVADKPPAEGSESSLRNKTLRGFGWAAIGSVIRAVLQFAVLAVLARLLSPADFGLVGAALVVIGISYWFSQMGVGPALVQQRELDEKHINTASGISLVLAIFTFGVLFHESMLIERLFKMPGLSPVVRWLSLIFPIIGFAVVPEAILQRRLDFKNLAICDTISNFFGYGIITVAVAWATHSYMAMVAGFLAQGLFRTLLINWYGRQSFRPRWHQEQGWQLLNFSFLFTISQFINYIAVNADNFVVGRFLGPAALGIYGRAYQTMVVPAALVGDTIDKVLYPAVSQVSDSQESMSRIFERGNRLLAVVFLPASGALCILSREIVLLLLGPKWLAVCLPLSIFSLGLFFRTTPKLCNTFIKATGKVDKLALYQAVYAAAVALLAYFCLGRGVAGVCVGVLGAIVLFYLMMTGLALRITATRWTHYLLLHAPAFVLALLVTGLTALLTGWMRHVALPPLVILIVTSTLAALLTAGSIWTFPEAFLGEHGRMIRSGLKPYLRASMSAANSTTLRDIIAEDLRYYSPSQNVVNQLCVALWNRNFHVLLFYRLGHECVAGRLTKPLIYPLKWIMGAISGCEISFHSKIGRRFYLPHPSMIIIGEGAVIGDDVTIYHGVTLGRRGHDPHGGSYPTIESRSTVYAVSSLLGGITVGAGATIGAHSLVLHDVPAGATALGCPARVVGKKSNRMMEVVS